MYENIIIELFSLFILQVTDDLFTSKVSIKRLATSKKKVLELLSLTVFGTT